MSPLTNERLSVVASPGERAELRALERILERADDPTPVFAMTGNECARIPESALAMLHHFASLTRRGLGALLLPLERHITTQEAAEILNVSRPWVVKLIDRGEIPHVRVGNRRRVTLVDVLNYQSQRDATTRRSLSELVKLDEKHGLSALEMESG